MNYIKCKYKFGGKRSKKEKREEVIGFPRNEKYGDGVRTYPKGSS